MKYIFTASLMVGFLFPLTKIAAQKYSATEGFIQFYSSAPLEDIKAVNKNIKSIFNSQTNDIAFSVPIDQFKFQKKLMQEHFNEKYLESDRYPLSTFSGKLSGFDGTRDGLYPVSVSGKLTIHGVTKELHVEGTIQRSADHLYMKSLFKIRLADFNITVPQLMWQNIAEEVEVTVELTFKPQ